LLSNKYKVFEFWRTRALFDPFDQTVPGIFLTAMVAMAALHMSYLKRQWFLGRLGVDMYLWLFSMTTYEASTRFIEERSLFDQIVHINARNQLNISSIIDAWL
jgi:hypothetical protein